MHTEKSTFLEQGKNLRKLNVLQTNIVAQWSLGMFDSTINGYKNMTGMSVKLSTAYR